MTMTGNTDEMTPRQPDGPVKSQTDRAVTILRDKILANELGPGSNHLESELAEMLGMSRTPVREALLVLETQGLVEIRPRRGVRILPLSAQDMQEIYLILTELESLAAAEVAGMTLLPEDLARLEAPLLSMEQALDKDDRRAWAEADDIFHRQLIDFSSNNRLKQMVRMLWDQVHRARLLTLHLRPAPHSSNSDHRALLEAIANGMVEDARRIHREHLTKAREMIVLLLRKHGFYHV